MLKSKNELKSSHYAIDNITCVYIIISSIYSYRKRFPTENQVYD